MLAPKQPHSRRFALILAFLASPVAVVGVDDGCPLEGCEASAILDDAVGLMQTSLKQVRNSKGMVDAEVLIEDPLMATRSATLLAVSEKQSNNSNASEANTTAPAVNADAAAVGVKGNSAGDLSAFLAAFVTNVVTMVGCVSVFMCLRRRYPMTYSNNKEAGFAPPTEAEGTFDWAKLSLYTDTDQRIESIGLDNAMLIEFTQLAMKILAIIGVPMLCIIGPMNCFFGGYAAGDDYLSYLSFGNVENGSWLYWVHACCVWGVVIVVKTCVYNAQEAFLKKRYIWLRQMDETRANTILVEGIPEGYRSDAKVREFFAKMFKAENIKEAYVVKDTDTLLALFAQKKVVDESLLKAEKLVGGNNNGEVAGLSQEVAKLEQQIKAEQQRIQSAAATEGGVNLWSAFVTFKNRSTAEIARKMEYVADGDEWVVSTPPEAQDIRWGDLKQSPHGQTVATLIGTALVVGLYFAYMPLVIGITTISTSINLGPLQPLWAGLAPTMGLTIMVGFLPTFLILIYNAFFTLKADAFAQNKLQNSYFWFQVVFVLLVTAIGGSVEEFTETLFTSPFAIFGLLGTTLPNATHFYLNFLVLQWVTHSMNLMRYVMLSKWFAFRQLHDDETARKLSEPEDQDYYGLGSRSARFIMNLCIGIVYGTMSPPMNLLCFINFACCRLFYGYLIPFAETKKADLGGHFWVMQLQHLFIGAMIYCIAMIGVLTGRAANMGPAVLATPSLLYVVLAYRRFQTAFSWENLPFSEAVEPPDAKKLRHMKGQYKQPELMPQK